MSTQTTGLTLAQRIMADTPPFFKGVQIFAAFLLLVAAVLVKLNIGSADVHSLLGTIGFVAMGVAQCAAKDASLLTSGLTADNVIQAFTQTSAEIQSVKTEIKTPAAIPDPGSALSSVVADVEGNVPDASSQASPADDQSAAPATPSAADKIAAAKAQMEVLK